MVKEHHLDLGVCIFIAHYMGSCVSLYSGPYNGLMDCNTRGTRQGNVKLAPKTRPIAPLFMTDVVCIVFSLWYF
jgi:hypothetical protein